MNGWVLLGTVAASVILVAIQLYRESRYGSHEEEEVHREQRPRDGLGHNQTVSGNRLQDSVRARRRPKPPGREDKCPICLSLLFNINAQSGYSIIPLHPCHHWLHKTCAIRLLEYNDLCPVCRITIDKSKLKRANAEDYPI